MRGEPGLDPDRPGRTASQSCPLILTVGLLSRFYKFCFSMDNNSRWLKLQTFDDPSDKPAVM